MGLDKPERLDTLLPVVLQRIGERYGALFEIQRDWIQLVGRKLAAHTKPVGLRHGALTVYIDRPGDGFALSYRKPELLERLRAATQGKVAELVIRPGDPPWHGLATASRAQENASRHAAPRCPIS